MRVCWACPVVGVGLQRRSESGDSRRTDASEGQQLMRSLWMQKQSMVDLADAV
jgi:hypothetical protein